MDAPRKGLRIRSWMWNYGHFLVLFAIVSGAAALGVRWVFLVPMYQAPDEPTHFDYVLSLYQTRSLTHAQSWPAPGDPGWFAHPYSMQLISATRAGEIIFHPERRMLAGYGTYRFFQNVESKAPRRKAIHIDRPAMLASVYPFGYYAAAAVWLEIVRHVHDGPVGLFFEARLFSVFLFTVSLVLSYASCRELLIRRWLALALTAIIGFFPLATFVSSSVQPDNLSFMLVSLCFFLSLRWNRRPTNSGLSTAMGLSLGLLLVTKTQFFLCVSLPVFALVVVRLGVERTRFLGWVRHGILLLAPAVLLWSIHLSVVSGVKGYYDDFPPYKDFNTTVLNGFTNAFLDYYRDTTHKSFWGVFGWLDTPLIIRDQKTTTTVKWVIDACGWIILVLTLLRLEQVGAKLWRLWRRGKGQAALRIALSNVPINSYFLYTLVMFVLYICLENRFGAQGRNWVPFLLPFFLTAIMYAPKALTLRGARRTCAMALLVGLLLFDGFGSYYALKTIKQRYYAPGEAPRFHILHAVSTLPVAPLTGRTALFRQHLLAKQLANCHLDRAGLGC